MTIGYAVKVYRNLKNYLARDSTLVILLCSSMALSYGLFIYGSYQQKQEEEQKEAVAKEERQGLMKVLYILADANKDNVTDFYEQVGFARKQRLIPENAQIVQNEGPFLDSVVQGMDNEDLRRLVQKHE
jgi:hypothetical protein